MSDNWLISLLRDPITPAYVVLLIFAGACLRWGGGIMQAFTERLRTKANISAEEHLRLREENRQRAEENSGLRERLNECEDARVEWMRRAVTAESTLQGLGTANQYLQLELSAERLREDLNKKSKDGS